MEAFDNCRICLHEINHEPIKMTRLILKFLEKTLQLSNVSKPKTQENLKQNLCAVCFNKISEFQDFYEQCIDSDEFWKAQFNVLKETVPERQLSFEQADLLPLTEDSSSLEADTTVTTAEEENKEQSYQQSHLSLSENDITLTGEEEVQKVIVRSTTPIKDDNNAIQIEKYNQSVDLNNWSEEISNDNESDIQIVEEEEDDKVVTKSFTDEIIEYEYQIEENEEIEEFTVFEEIESSESVDVDYLSFDYEKIDTEIPSQSTTTKSHQAVRDSVKDQSENTTQNTFFMTTTIDENGTVKTVYKCQLCDKTFNRVYDIESHYNIHNGVKPYTCQVCGKSFRQKNILTTHQTLHFGKKVECAECGKKFARRSQLILHYRMHRNEKPFVCNYDGCDAAFRQRKQLMDHSYIHSGEKNFQCTTCTKSFHTRKRLQDHIYKVHSQHRYRCDLCDKAFLKPHMLKHHMVTAHNVEIDDVSHLKTLVENLKPTQRKVTRQV